MMVSETSVGDLDRADIGRTRLSAEVIRLPSEETERIRNTSTITNTSMSDVMMRPASSCFLTLASCHQASPPIKDKATRSKPADLQASIIWMTLS